MLKQELLAPATLEGQPQDDVDAARSLAAKALPALRACCAALGPGQLDRVVLGDVAVEDLLRYLSLGPEGAAAATRPRTRAPDNGAGVDAVAATAPPPPLRALRGRPARRLACIADVLGAVSRAVRRAGQRWE